MQWGLRFAVVSLGPSKMLPTYPAARPAPSIDTPLFSLLGVNSCKVSLNEVRCSFGDDSGSSEFMTRIHTIDIFTYALIDVYDINWYIINTLYHTWILWAIHWLQSIEEHHGKVLPLTQKHQVMWTFVLKKATSFAQTSLMLFLFSEWIQTQ